MLFNTPAFAVFLAVVLLFWFLLERWNPIRMALLLAASLWFYAHWDWRYVFLLLGVTTVDWALALWLARQQSPQARKAIVTLTVIVNLGVLGFFKYTGFLLESLRPLGELAGVELPEPLHLVLPVGISFFTFQGLGYVVDVYRREMAPIRSLPRFALVKAFFPQLVAGPIVRPSVLAPQFDRPELVSGATLGRAVGLVVRGLVKKAAADYLAANLVDRVFDVPRMYTSTETLAGIYGYALQIYGDFSGYTDVAIGLALMLGFRLPANFDHPYASTSLREFWRRWHISLSSWLRDYLYIPLGGSRGGFWSTQRNNFLTMLLGGLWHGASWNFVLWGAMHGAWLVVERLWSRWRGEPEKSVGTKPTTVAGRIQSVLGWFITFHMVCLLWIFFRADTFAGAIGVIRQVFEGGSGHANITPKLAALMAAGFAAHLAPASWRERAYEAFDRSPALVHAAAVLAALYAARALAGASEQPFIYFQF